MRQTTRLAAAVAMFFASTSPALRAQSQDENPLQTSLKDAGRITKRQAQRDPLMRSGLSFSEPQLTLETTKGKGRATGAIGFVKDHVNGETTFGISISSPIGDAADAEARPADLRGLGDGATIELSVGGSSLFKGQGFSVADVPKACARFNVVMADCTAGKLEDTNPEASRALLDLVFKEVPILYGASVTYGRNKFSFSDAAGTKQDPVRHSDLGIEGSIGFLVNERRALIVVGAAYADAFTASPNKTQLCRPLTGSTATRCDAAIIGAPLEEKSLVYTLEYKVQLRTTSKIPVSFAPKAQLARGLDGARNVQSLEAPFYFFQEKPDPKSPSPAPKLNGGLTAGWRSDEGFRVGVFIGAAFTLFN